MYKLLLLALAFSSSMAFSMTLGVGDICYKECKPVKDINASFMEKASGKEPSQSGFERNSCRSCLQKYPMLFKMAVPEESAVNCTLSNDKQYATCNGDTYKLDSSVDLSDRSILKDVPAPNSGSGSGRSSSGSAQ